MKKIIFFVSLFILSSFLFAQEKDVPGSKDHPVLSRYPGCVIVDYSQKEFGEYVLPISGPLRNEKDVKAAKTKKLEGKVTKIRYKCPQSRSNLEIYKNYELALTNAGFKIFYTGKGNEIRGIHNLLWNVNHDPIGGWDDPDIRPWFYISASSPNEKIFISLFIIGSYDGPKVVLSVIEPKAMETGLVTAEMMEAQIKQTGKVAIYSIYFDFDKADIKSESKPTIEEIAKLLKRNPSLKLYIVGHTDNVGNFEYNIKLSERRAEAVVRELVEKYGISKDRLRAYGVGPLCPVSTNETEEGRANNRRVELVKQ